MTPGLYSEYETIATIVEVCDTDTITIARCGTWDQNIILAVIGMAPTVSSASVGSAYRARRLKPRSGTSHEVP